MRKEQKSKNTSKVARLTQLCLPVVSVVFYVLLDSATNSTNTEIGNEIYRQWGLVLLLVIIMFTIISAAIVTKLHLWTKPIYVASLLINVVIAVILVNALLLIAPDSFQF